MVTLEKHLEIGVDARGGRCPTIDAEAGHIKREKFVVKDVSGGPSVTEVARGVRSLRRDCDR